MSLETNKALSFICSPREIDYRLNGEAERVETSMECRTSSSFEISDRTPSQSVGNERKIVKLTFERVKTLPTFDDTKTQRDTLNLWGFIIHVALVVVHVHLTPLATTSVGVACCCLDSAGTVVDPTVDSSLCLHRKAAA